MPNVDQQRVEHWVRIVSIFNSSELSLAEFCRRQKLSVHQFQYWRRRLAETVTTTANSPAANKTHPRSPQSMQDSGRDLVTDTPVVQIRLVGQATVLVPAHMLETIRAVLEMVNALDRSSQQQSSNVFHAIVARP
jgi:hypothetical protein